MDGQDMVWVDFFDKSAWMGKQNQFPKWFEEVHDAGSYPGFLKEFEATTNGDTKELWVFRADLCSSDRQVKQSGQ